MLNVTISFSFLFSYGFALSRCNSEDTVGGAVSVTLKIDVFHSDNAFSLIPPSVTIVQLESRSRGGMV